MKRYAIGLALLAAAALGPAAASGSVAPGGNGMLVFTSGLGGDAGDNDAKIHAMFPSSILPTQITFADLAPIGNSRHSHPTWSPDATKIAYAKSESVAGARDIWIRDLSADPPTEVNITQTATIDEDRPEFSPDGTKIAYGDRAVAGADPTTEADIWVQSNLQGTGNRVNITNTPTDSEDRPAWSPDGQFIYVAYDPSSPYNSDQDIYRLNADGSGIPIAIINTATNEWQPQISPDGSKVCYSYGGTSNMDPGGVDVYVANSAPGSNASATPFKDSTTMGEFNCTWSPDGTKIAYTFGVFSSGGLNIADYPSGANNDEVFDEPGVFDGNSNWGTNAVPVCESVSRSVNVNGFVSVPLTCTDRPDPLTYTTPNNPFEADIASSPANGSLGSVSNDAVIYTPKLNFKGTDTFTFETSDGTSDSNLATATITVAQGGGGGGNQPGVDPEITGLGVSPKRWKRGGALPQLSAATGTTISFNLNEDARTRLAFQRARPGRRVGGKCRKPTRRNRGKRRCTRYVSAGSFSIDAKSGSNRLRFQGRLSSRKRLKLGKHRVTLRATDADNNNSNQPRASFTVTRR